jgi:predicted secreted hydrolase
MNKFKYFFCYGSILLLNACSNVVNQKIEKPNPLIEIMSLADNSGFARADKKIEFLFPKDHYAHNDFKAEWWYFTGNLEDNTGRSFGYQFTIFRNAVIPSDLLTSIRSAWHGNQFYLGHLAISDISNKKFYSFELLERDAIGLAGISEKPFKLWVNNWSMESVFDDIFPMKLKAMENGVGIELTVNPIKEIVLQGDEGLSQKSLESGNSSYYYSIPRLETSGLIKIIDEEFQVHGHSWMDREWSTSALSSEQEGWDWFSLQLSNNTELMYYQLRNKDGTVSETSRASFIKEDSSKIDLLREEVMLEVLDYLQHKDSRYPIKWLMRVPSLNLDLLIEPLMKNQVHEFYIPYWEGAVKVSSHNGLKGKGYAELTGY